MRGMDEDATFDHQPATQEEYAPQAPSTAPARFSPQDYYNIYSTDPSPQNLNQVMNSLKPVIAQSLVGIGEHNNPMLTEKARIFALQAVKKYSPEYGASLHTWVRGQLMQLNRARREMNSPIKVPERIQLDAFHIKTKENEFIDKHGREPDVHELADITRLPVKRIAKVRTQFYRVPTSMSLPEESLTQAQTDYTDETMSYIFDSADYIDRKLMEHRFGYGGGEIIPNQDLAAKLRLRPDAVSKRYKKLEAKIRQTHDILSKTYE